MNKQSQVLLVKRKDFPLWGLPGGKLDEGELLENCAVRETVEETGYNISIKRKIGEYYEPQIDDMQHLFLGEVYNGSSIIDGPETEKVEWFIPEKLPLLMVPDRRKQITNFLQKKIC